MSKKAWIWGGVAVAGVGATIAIVAVSRREKPKKGDKRVDAKPPGNATPEGSGDADGVFRLSGAGLRQVACDARKAKSGAELARVLRGVQDAVRISGASKVDARNTGLVTEVMTAEAFDAELAKGIREVEGISGFAWLPASLIVKSKLSGLPECDASAQTWEAVAAGVVQQAMTMESVPEPIWGLPRALEEARAA
ncbi:MAG: hypothetical protein ACRBN8_19665 [Nannocystales bacterium]